MRIRFTIWTDGDITRSDYQHTAIQRLELGIDDGNDMAWAQVMGPYLIYYDTKTELMYSCNLDVGTIVLFDFDGVSDPSGLCGNGNWVYGLYDGKLVVRPNGSELQTIYEPDDSLELVSVEHAMENYIILTAKNTANIKRVQKIIQQILMQESKRIVITCKLES